MKISKVLVVDDEVGFTRLLKLNLEQTGKYEVLVKNTGEEGAHVASFFKPDLVLLDVVMPDISGREVAARLKDDPATAGIPILFLTATVSKQDIQSNPGVLDGYRSLAKPVKLDNLLESIEAELANVNDSSV